MRALFFVVLVICGAVATRDAQAFFVRNYEEWASLEEPIKHGYAAGLLENLYTHNGSNVREIALATAIGHCFSSAVLARDDLAARTAQLIENGYQKSASHHSSAPSRVLYCEAVAICRPLLNNVASEWGTTPFENCKNW